MEQQMMETARLVLRGLDLDDAGHVRRLAGDRAVAAMTLRIPHPYEEGMAETWIRQVHEQTARDEVAVFAIVARASGELVGAVGLEICPEHQRAELGYWIGRQWWGRGYATEAAREIVRLGFEQLGLERIYAHHFAENTASGRVMQKLGMRHEGRLRRHIVKWGHPVDLELYGLLRQEFEPEQGR